MVVAEAEVGIPGQTQEAAEAEVGILVDLPGRILEVEEGSPPFVDIHLDLGVSAIAVALAAVVVLASSSKLLVYGHGYDEQVRQSTQLALRGRSNRR